MRGFNDGNSSNIMVNRAMLLDRLKFNRQQHIAEVEKAQTNYRAEVLKQTRKYLRLVRDETKEVDRNFIFRHLPEPLSFVEEYDAAIEQTEWDTRNEVNLSRDEFNRYVRNVWEWRNQYMASSSAYLAE